MGNYERTLKDIERYEEIISRLEVELSMCESEEESSYIMESLADYHQSVGECRGYLEELAEMDGYRSYEDMCYAEACCEF